MTIAKNLSREEATRFSQYPKDKRDKLAQTVRYSVAFQKMLAWKGASPEVYLANTPEALLRVYRLRSQVYREMGYDNEFPDPIDGINYDSYDRSSAVLYTEDRGEVTGTCRVIFDTSDRLPIDKNYSLDHLRSRNVSVAELSRMAVLNIERGRGNEYKRLMRASYEILRENGVHYTVCVVPDKHIKLYSKFGGVTIEKIFHGYGEIERDFVVASWRLSQTSSYFRRAFLGEHRVAS